MGVSISLSRFINGLFGYEIIFELKDIGAVIVKHGNEKILLFNNAVYSKLRYDSIYTHSYWDFFDPLPALYEKPRVLVIGLGGGTIPFQLSKIFGDSVTIDIVEIEKEMPRVADAFLPEKLRSNIIIEDGYSYVQKFSSFYDIIILDSFIRYEVPGKFLDQKFVESCNAALKPNGILAMNYIVDQSDSKLQDFKERASKLFNIYTIKYSSMSGNRIFLCSKTMDKTEIMDKVKRNFPINRENSFIPKVYSKMY